MCLNNHGEVGVVCLWHILLVFAQLNRHNVAKVRTRVIPGRKKMRILHAESELKSSPGPGHEPKDEGFLWPGDLVGSPEHLLGLQHLILGEGQIPPLPWHRGDWGCDCLHSRLKKVTSASTKQP